MRWLIGLLILLQIPLVILVFLAGGTDGKKSSLILIWSVTIPIFLCSIYAIYRLVRADRLIALHWVAIAVAFAPLAWLASAIVVNAVRSQS